MKPFEAFLHPRRTARRLNEIEAEMAAIELNAAADAQAREEAERKAAAAEAEAETLRGRLAEQEISQRELMNLLLTTRTDLEGKICALREELNQTGIDNAELEEINLKIEEMCRRQESYRERIADLKRQLAEARAQIARLSGRKTSGLHSAISMTSEASDLNEPTEIAQNQGVKPKPKRVEIGTLARESEDVAAETEDAAGEDWLLPLPE